MFGGSGFIGRALIRHLHSAGHTIRQFVRVSAAFIEERGVISWDPYNRELPERYLEGCDTVINLCGVGLTNGRWTAEYKRQIVDSRVLTNELIAKKVAGMEHPPHNFLHASAVGYYGLRDIGQQLVENCPNGSGFLADVCSQWEGATSIAEWAGIRVVHMRFGPVLGIGGGMLAKLLPLFKANLGGRLGHGQQPISWIAMPDLLRAVEFLLDEPLLTKAVNITAPNPVTNAKLSKELAAVLGKQAWATVPAWVLVLVYGQMAREALLGGQAAVPRKLREAGFQFRYPELGGALSHILS